MDLVLQCLNEKDALEETIISLAKRSAIERVARLFVGIHSRLFRGWLEPPLTFKTPLRREDLSDAIGLTPVHVSRTLTVLNQQSIMRFDRGSVEIIDYDKLIAIANAS